MFAAAATKIVLRFKRFQNVRYFSCKAFDWQFDFLSERMERKVSKTNRTIQRFIDKQSRIFFHSTYINYCVPICSEVVHWFSIYYRIYCYSLLAFSLPPVWSIEWFACPIRLFKWRKKHLEISNLNDFENHSLVYFFVIFFLLIMFQSFSNCRIVIFRFNRFHVEWVLFFPPSHAKRHGQLFSLSLVCTICI